MRAGHTMRAPIEDGSRNVPPAGPGHLQKVTSLRVLTAMRPPANAIPFTASSDGAIDRGRSTRPHPSS